MNFTTYLFGSTLLEQTFHRAMQMLASISLEQIAIAVTLFYGLNLADRNVHANVRPSVLHNFVVDCPALSTARCCRAKVRRERQIAPPLACWGRRCRWFRMAMGELPPLPMSIAPID